MKEAELDELKRRATRGLTIADTDALFAQIDRSRLESDRLRAAEHAQMLRGMHLADALHTLCVGLTVSKNPLQHIARSALVLYGDSHSKAAEPEHDERAPETHQMSPNERAMRIREQAKPKPTAEDIAALQRTVNELNEHFYAYDVGDRPMSPPAELMRRISAAETALSNARQAASVE